MTRHSENDSSYPTRPPGLRFKERQNDREIPAKTQEPLAGWAEAYEAVLYQYLDRPRKSGLRKAADAGRLAAASGLPVAALAGIHNEAVSKFLIRTPTSPERRPAAGFRTGALIAAAEFFSKCIAPFGPHEGELERANAALLYGNRTLEEKVGRLSGVVFDDVLQLAAAAGLAVEAIVGRTEPDALGHVNELRHILDLMVNRLTSSTIDLQPRVLADLGLGSAIRLMARCLPATTRIELAASREMAPLPLPLSTVLYRGIEESLRNIRQHARAGVVQIDLGERNGVVRCSVQDDGIGFDPSQVFTSVNNGSGLLYLRQSLRAIGGDLTIKSAPGSGTGVTMEVLRHDAVLARGVTAEAKN